MLTENKYSIARILESIRKSECIHIQQNCYLFDYRDEILETIGNKLDIDFTKQILSLGEIKKKLRTTKK